MATDTHRISEASEAPRRLKLNMPSTSSSPSSTQDHSLLADKASSRSPDRPSWSPVTPTLSQTSLALPQPNQQAAPPDIQWMDHQPNPVPLSLDENPDAMAMSAAISILQMQRQQALRDMRDLDKLKKAALADPESFVEDLNAGKLAPAPRPGVHVDHESDEDEADVQQGSNSKFGKLPSAQNVVRAPPVEWAKYHILGEPLDRMHEFQRQYPGVDEDMLDVGEKPWPHVVASPYKPFTDKLNDPKTSS